MPTERAQYTSRAYRATPTQPSLQPPPLHWSIGRTMDWGTRRLWSWSLAIHLYGIQLEWCKAWYQSPVGVYLVHLVVSPLCSANHLTVPPGTLHRAHCTGHTAQGTVHSAQSTYYHSAQCTVHLAVMHVASVGVWMRRTSGLSVSLNTQE